MFFGKDIRVGFPDNFIDAVHAKLFGERRTDSEEPAIGILEVDRIRQVLHQRRQQMAFESKFLLGINPRGDVPKNQLQTGDFAVAIANGALHTFDPSHISMNIDRRFDTVQ